MKLNNQFQPNHVFVLGLGKSGMSTVRELTKRNVHLTVNDGSNKEKCPYLDELTNLDVDVHFGGHPLSLLSESVDLIIKTPGIPYTNPILVSAKERNIPIITEIELGYLLTNSKIAAITGSNGKTTTSSLVGKIMETAQLAHSVCGNIGNVFLEQATDDRNEWLVAELSSFQLEGTVEFKPNIACMLNFSETHLDFHETKENYWNAKLNIFRNQTENNQSLLNYDEPLFHAMSENLPSDTYWFSRFAEVPKGAYIIRDSIFFKDGYSNMFIMNLNDIPLKGNHNIENVLAAVAIAALMEIDPKLIRLGVMQFQAVEHRLEFVSTIGGVNYYNDSKSTNPTSTIKAIESFQQPVVLIVGGKDRGADFTDLQKSLLNSTVKGVLTFGETNLQLAKMAREIGITETDTFSTVAECVRFAQSISKPNDTVLFSPGCASWDAYTSYEERGIDFKNSIQKEVQTNNA